jgi:hypothetical protein
MTETKFISETSENELQVFQFDNFIEISIDELSSEYNMPAVHLTIKDAELLMNELHKVISQIEGGKI